MTPTPGAGPAHPGDAEVTDDFELAGVPDAFQRLWTPHRLAYIKGGQDQFKDKGCPFCIAPTRSDEESLIVHRGEHSYVVLNLYPYHPGHLLVVPYRHIPDYTDIDEAETAEFAALTQTGMRVLREVSNATGFNIGMNQGMTGGAGIASHLHQHVVPRWGGDGNFLPIIAQTKAVTQTLDEVRRQVSAGWPGRPGAPVSGPGPGAAEGPA